MDFELFWVVEWNPTPTATVMPVHIKANLGEASLLSFETIVFVTKYLAHLLQLALGLGKIGDGVHGIKNMHKTTELMSKNQLSSGLWGFFIDVRSQVVQLILSNILNIPEYLAACITLDHK